MSQPIALIARLRQAARALKRDGLTLWYALQDPATPWWVRALIVLVVGYALSPIDLIPDFIPVLGLLDDLVLLPGLIWLALRLLPASVKAAASARCEAHLAAQQPKVRLRWGGALIVGVWALALVCFWQLFKHLA
ncbi:MAG: YkvA family protein [Betaproteobacteria bacterium]